MENLFSEKEVLCPICKFDYTFPIKVETNSGGKITEVTAEGTKMDIGVAEGRGVVISITFQCEDGHQFVKEYKFHKGITFESTYKQECEAGQHVIWRD